MTRDSQKSRVYKAETPLLNGGSRQENPEPMTPAQCQQYVDKVLRSPFVQSRWGTRTITVTAGRYGGWATSSRINLGVWARQPLVILHELAHSLNSGHQHDEVFAAGFLLLVQRFMGADAAALLRQGYKTHRVKHRNGVAALPKPGSRPIVTQAATAARKRAADVRPVARTEASEAARVLRRAIKTGMFGEPGRKPRAHAQAVARMLEKGTN